MRHFRYFDLVMAMFVAVLLISNVAASAKIVDLGTALFGMRLSFDGGTLLFPLSYIFGDVLTEVYGYGRSRRVIWTGFFCSALMSSCLFVVSALPGDQEWINHAGDEDFQAILGGVSNGAIVLASLVAYFLGEFSNSYVLAKMKVWTDGEWLWTRTIGSTVVGQGIDTASFVLMATVFGVFPWSLFWNLVAGNYFFKVTMEIVLTPVTYRVIAFLKREEQEDYYDRDTDFNPFRLSRS